jgi:hypothetical protein
LGGTYRYLPTGSVFGVHRFFWEQHTASDADLAQIVSAVVVEYIRTMGVSTRLFALASQAGPSELVTPSHQVLLSLNVVNDGSKPTKWTIESLSGALYLKGEQETALGINKFMLTCPMRGPMYLYVLFDAGQNTNEVMAWPTNWLFFDGKRIEIQNRLTTKVVLNGRINLIYVPDHNLMETIAGTKSEIGVGLSPTSGSAIFNGFAKMPFKGAAAKLPGFLQVCGPRVADK